MDAAHRSVVVVDAPTNLGLVPPAPGKEPGVRGLASALRANGLVLRLDGTDGGNVAPQPYTPDVDPTTGVLNAEALRSFCLSLADRVGAVVRAGDFPLVLGGDCSVLIGNMLALRRLGRYGLVFLDGHSRGWRGAASETSS